MKTDKEAVQWEKVHVFVSSTFNDMHAERDYLVKRVFPELQDWCERRKLRLVDIDLRWGVTEADATHNKNVVKVCLSRIDDCRPFFLCFLGQRRGWVPKENEVSPETFDAFPDLRPVVGGASVTELEILHALINPFHQRSERDSSKLTEYYERAKHSFFYLRDPSYLDQLPTDPQMLRETYTNELIEDATKREKDDEALKNWREVKIPKSHRPWHLYQATWNSTETTPEIMMPLQCPSVEPGNIKRWKQQWRKAGVPATVLNLEDDEDQSNQATEFNSRLSAGRLSDFKCEEVLLSEVIIRELKEAIAERYHDHSEVEHEDELQKEIDQQGQFLFTASEGFIPRAGDFAELDDYAESDSNKLFVLTAAGGMGKSTLLANWIERYRRRIKDRADHSIHFRFIGQSDLSSTVPNLLHYILRELQEVEHKIPATTTATRTTPDGRTEAVEVPLEIPLEPVKLIAAWSEYLSDLGKRGNTVIVLDALNQLESALTDVGWLPRQLPDNVKLIVSFKRGDESAEKLYEQFSEGNRVILSEVKPFNRRGHRRKLVKAYLSQYLKDLDKPNRELLINLPGAENPLYLKVVLSELRVFGAYGNLASKIRDDFGDTPVSAFVGVLKRLENDPAYSPIDPKQAVPLLFGLLAHARRGLSVDELTSLFIQAFWSGSSPTVREGLAGGSEETGEWREAAADTVNLFLRQVRSFMARREGRYDFFFESFKTAAQQCYVTDVDQEAASNRSYQEWHRLLSNYFKTLPTWEEAMPSSEPPQAAQAQPTRQPTRRKVGELLHHLIESEQQQVLEEMLCDLDFIEAKCLVGLVFDLLTDIDAGLNRWELASVRQVRQAIASSLRTILEHPTFTLAALCNRLARPDELDDRIRAVVAHAKSRLMERGPWLETASLFPGNEGIVYSQSSSYQAFASAQQAVAAADSEGKVEIRDIHRGEIIATRSLPAKRVVGIAIQAQELNFAWIEADRTVRTELGSQVLRSRKGETILSFLDQQQYSW